MLTVSSQERAEHLRREIARHDDLYYKKASPEISDAQYDALVRELSEIEAQHPDVVVASSPTQNVGSDLDGGFTQMTHKAPMLSIANCYNEEEFQAFDAQVRRELGLSCDVIYAVELKIDGASISITYENGMLKNAVTRGDGAKGDDVTENVLTIPQIPRVIPGMKGTVEVRGEIYCPKSVFAALNVERAAAGKPLFANPRNTASGSLKQRDPKEAAKRRLAAIFYTVGYVSDDANLPQTQDGLLDYFRSVGLPTSDAEQKMILASGVSGVMDRVAFWESYRKTLDYETDGLVVKVNDRQRQNILGLRSKSPRWAVAWKYSAEQQETKVESVAWQVGRTGAVTPVANLAPVMLSGTTVRRATLHNPNEIQRLGLRVGDTVLAEKAAEIIPRVVSVVIEKRTGEERDIQIPSHCPSCSEPLCINPDEAVLRCTNVLCPAQAHEKIEHFGSRHAMEIEGLGEKIVGQLIESGLIRDVSDLYVLTEAQLVANGFGKRSAQKLVQAISNSKLRPLARFLYALGIRNVGEGTSSDLAKHFSTFEAVRAATREDLRSVSGIGDEIADSLIAFFSDKKQQVIVDLLLEHGVAPEADRSKEIAAANRDETFADKTFVFTGELSGMGRAAAEREVQKRGGRTSGSVSKNTYCVVVGDTPGSKFTKAKALGVMIWTEEQFMDALNKKTIPTT